MKNKNFRKLKYVRKPPECRILHHLPNSFWRPWRLTDLRPKFFSLASLAVLHLIFQNSLLLLKVLKALMTDEGYYDFLLFLLAIVLFVLLRYTDSDSLFDILKLVLFNNGVVRSELDIYLFM